VPFSFPVRIEGLPDPEVLIIPLTAGVLGFIQWFVVVPWIARRLSVRLRRAAILLAVWLLAEAAAIVVSMSLNRTAARISCHVNVILFHAWLAIPAVVAATAGSLAASRLIDSQNPRRWTVLLAGLFLVAGAALQTAVLFDPQSTANRIGVLLELLLPACACMVAGSFASRLPHAHRAAGASS
jgi:hypothetical protein